MGFCLSGSFQAGGEGKGPHVHKKAAEDILYLPAIHPRAKVKGYLSNSWIQRKMKHHINE